MGKGNDPVPAVPPRHLSYQEYCAVNLHLGNCPPARREFSRQVRRENIPGADDICGKRKCDLMWAVYAVLSAVFASLTSILAKIGIENVNSNLATALRTVVVLALAWGIVFATGAQSGLPLLSRRSWIFLGLSGLATGLSWICYYKAIQIGEVAKVVPIDKFSIVLTLILAFAILREPLTLKAVLGGLLITAGTFVMIL